MIKDIIILSLGAVAAYFLFENILIISRNFFSADLAFHFMNLSLFLICFLIVLIFLGFVVENYLAMSLFFISLVFFVFLVAVETRDIACLLIFIVAVMITAFRIRLEEKNTLNPNPLNVSRRNLGFFFLILSIVQTFLISQNTTLEVARKISQIPKENFYLLDNIIAKIPHEKVKKISMRDRLEDLIAEQIKPEGEGSGDVAKNIERKIQEICRGDQECIKSIENTKKELGIDLGAGGLSQNEEISKKIKDTLMLDQDIDLNEMDLADLIKTKLKDLSQKINRKFLSVSIFSLIMPTFLTYFWILGLLSSFLAYFIYLIFLITKVISIEVIRKEKKRFY